MRYQVVMTFRYDVEGDNEQSAIDEAYFMHYQYAQLGADADSVDILEYDD